MSQGFTAAFGGGLLSALFFVAILGGSWGALILGYLTPLPLFLVGFGLGLNAGLVAAGTAAVLVFGIYGSPIASSVFTVGIALPASLVVAQALLSRPAPQGGVEWYPPGPVLAKATIAGVGLIGLAFLAMIGADGGLRGVTEEVIAATFGPFTAAGTGDGAGTDGGAALAAGLAPIFPGVVTVSWLVMLIINALLAQGVLVRFESNRRPSMSLAEFALPEWAAPALAVAALVGLAGPGQLGYLGVNFAIVLMLPFFFNGLAVVHAFADARPARVPLLLAFYVFVILFGWPLLAVIGMGIADPWFDLRRRVRATGAGGRND